MTLHILIKLVNRSTFWAVCVFGIVDTLTGVYLHCTVASHSFDRMGCLHKSSRNRPAWHPQIRLGPNSSCSPAL